MRPLFTALMFALMAALVIAGYLAGPPGPIVQADHNRSGSVADPNRNTGSPIPRIHGKTPVSRMASWPGFNSADIWQIDAAEIEQAVTDEWAEAQRTASLGGAP